MTGNNTRKAVKGFLALFLFLSVVLFGFLYMAKGKIEAERAMVPILKQEASRPAQFTDDALVKVSVGAVSVLAQVAQSDAKKGLGLGDREKLEKGTGMLFAFETPGAYRFWNRGMRFPIDVIWILNDKTVDLYEHLPVYATEKDFTVTPKAPVNFVLEVPDGFIKENSIHVGDAITYEPEKN